LSSRSRLSAGAASPKNRFTSPIFPRYSARTSSMYAA
jgi:hypothetical protein